MGLTIRLFLEKHHYSLDNLYNSCYLYNTDKERRWSGVKLVTKSIRIDPELWHEARVKALSEKMTLQDLITKLLKQYLKKGG